jgi:hypothetical protein
VDAAMVVDAAVVVVAAVVVAVEDVFVPALVHQFHLWQWILQQRHWSLQS